MSDTGIRGTVARSGEPVEGANLRLNRDGGDFVAEIRSGPDGGFQFHVAAGSWAVVCLVPGEERIERRVELADGEVHQLDIALG
ncbi:MAG: carboxypeptidase-like regulatory domain-containing protein [Candidatus Dormibacteria bacterium]